jgi:hypothetical protein
MRRSAVMITDRVTVSHASQWAHTLPTDKRIVEIYMEWGTVKAYWDVRVWRQAEDGEPLMKDAPLAVDAWWREIPS